MKITSITTEDKRFHLKEGEGVDSVHSDPLYSYAVTYLHTNSGTTGIGITFTLGAGTDLICQAIELLSEELVGKDVDELMANFGEVSHRLANHPQLRWLGPQKGVVHLPQNVVNYSAIVSGMDISPTVAELAGVPAPADIDGKGMLPVLKQEKKEHHEWIAWAKNEKSWVLRKGKWKLSHDAGWGHKGFTIGKNSEVLPGEKMTYPRGINLFNLETDIGETTNVADQYPEVVQELLALHKDCASRMIPRYMKKKKKK